MTREETIKWLKSLKAEIGKSEHRTLWHYAEAVDMAIEALSAEAEPTVIRSRTLMPTKDFKEWAKRVRENNPSVIVIPCDAEVVPVETTATNTEKSSNCGDLISRADVIKAIRKCKFESVMPSDWYRGMECAQDIIEDIPSADRPSGEWVRSGNTLICPICGAKGEDIKDDYCFSYCPNCGAKMRNNK